MLLFFISSVSFTHPCNIFSFAARQTVGAARAEGVCFLSVVCKRLKYFILKKGQTAVGGWVGGGSYGGGVICELTSRERERARLSL